MPAGPRPPADAKDLRQRLASTRPQVGPDHPHVAANLSNLALILQDLRQPGQARPFLEGAQAITVAMQSAEPARTEDDDGP